MLELRFPWSVFLWDQCRQVKVSYCEVDHVDEVVFIPVAARPVLGRSNHSIGPFGCGVGDPTYRG